MHTGTENDPVFQCLWPCMAEDLSTFLQSERGRSSEEREVFQRMQHRQLLSSRGTKVTLCR